MDADHELEKKSQLDAILPGSSKDSYLDSASSHPSSSDKGLSAKFIHCRQALCPDEEAISSSINEGTNRKDKIVIWDDENDPENPKNFSSTRKWLIVTTTCSMTFCMTFASSIFTSTVAATGEEFGVSSELMLLGVALYVLGFAAGMNDIDS